MDDNELLIMVVTFALLVFCIIACVAGGVGIGYLVWG